MVHELKCEKQFFSATVAGAKPFELRLDDRLFSVGDLIGLNEVVKTKDGSVVHTGRHLLQRITFILKDYPGLEPNYVIIGTEILSGDLKGVKDEYRH